MTHIQHPQFVFNQCATVEFHPGSRSSEVKLTKGHFIWTRDVQGHLEKGSFPVTQTVNGLKQIIWP